MFFAAIGSPIGYELRAMTGQRITDLDNPKVLRPFAFMHRVKV